MIMPASNQQMQAHSTLISPVKCNLASIPWCSHKFQLLSLCVNLCLDVAVCGSVATCPRKIKPRLGLKHWLDIRTLV